MRLASFLSNSLLMIDFSIIIDILKYKNVQHAFALYPESAIPTRKIFHESKIRFSMKNERNSSTITPHSYQKVGIILNTACAEWKNVFDSLDLTKIFKSPFIWVIVTEDIDETTEILSKYPIEIDSDVTIIYKNKKIVSLYEMFNTGFALNGEVIVRQIGFWKNTLHIEQNNRFDLKGIVLKSTIVISKNRKIVHQTFWEFLEHEHPSLTGLTVDPMHKFKFFTVLKYFRDMFNISYTFQRSNSWGYPTNGSFDGMVGALQRYEADIGGSPLFVRTDRSKAVDYAAETWQTRPCFIFRHPKHPGGFYTIYTRPLATTVWYCIIAFLVLSTITLGLMLRVSRLWKTNEGDDSTSLALLFIWGAVCQQGTTISRSSTAVKMVVFVTFIFTLTIYQYYNATVVSTLLRDPPKNIRTMEDLLKSDLKAGIEDELYNKDFFKRTTDPLAIQMYNKRIVTGTQYNFYPSEVGMKLVKRGGYAFHVDSAVAYRIMRNTFTEKELCEATEISMYVPQYLGTAVTKRSPYKEHIAYGIRVMKERGIMRRLQTLWDESRPGCLRLSPGSSLRSVSLREFSTALMVLAVGYITAFLVLLLEMLGKYISRKNMVKFTH